MQKHKHAAAMRGCLEESEFVFGCRKTGDAISMQTQEVQLASEVP
jgi:hypothetical protein